MIMMPSALFATLYESTFRAHPTTVVTGHLGHQMHPVSYHHQDCPNQGKNAYESIGGHSQDSSYLRKRVVYERKIQETRSQIGQRIYQDQNETCYKKRHSIVPFTPAAADAILPIFFTKPALFGRLISRSMSQFYRKIIIRFVAALNNLHRLHTLETCGRMRRSRCFFGSSASRARSSRSAGSLAYKAKTRGAATKQVYGPHPVSIMQRQVP